MRRLLPALVLSFALAPALPALAQTANLPPEVVTTKQPLDEAAKAKVDAFVEERAALLAKGDPADVARARQDLCQPPRSVGASEIFRRAYSDVVRAKLKPIIESKDEFRAVNAITVLRFLATAEALEMLADASSVEKQPAEALRVTASGMLASACAQIARPNPPMELNGAQADALARRIREAATQETNWVVQMQLGVALGDVARWRGLPAASVENVRLELVRVLQAAVKAVPSDASGNRMRTVQRLLVIVRDQVMGGAKGAYTQQLEPVLAEVRTVAAKPPKDASEAVSRAFNDSGKLADLIGKISRGGG
ncbi:MAG: hypothetical protein U0574_11785 [Phycisphaerales bacterium]